MVGPAAKRDVVGWLRAHRHTSLRRACRVVGLSTATWRYRRHARAGDRELLARLCAHAAARPRYGYRRLHVLVARDGLVVNRKRVYRVYRAARLQVPRRRRKRLRPGARRPLPVPAGPRQRWSMDFMLDTLADGRPFRTLNIVDDYTRECVAIAVGRSLPGAHVVRVLDGLAATRGLPHTLVSDHGPEFTGQTLQTWVAQRGLTHRFIRPGKPMDNGYVESFNGKFRDECLNEQWFLNLADARATIEAWRVDYNTVRPHRALGQQTPAAYAAACAGPATGGGACSAALATTEQPKTPEPTLTTRVAD